MENEFTNEELHRIDVLYGNDFEDIKPEDASLIARWEQKTALESAEAQARFEAIEAEAAAKVEQAKKTAEYARKSLSELKNKALARLEGIDK